MGKAEEGGPESADNKHDQDSKLHEMTDPEINPDDLKLEPLMRAERLSGDIERFSELGLEMTEVLSRLSKELKISAEQLSRIRSAIDLKKNELKNVVDGSAAALERLKEEYRGQKEHLDRRIETQRELWAKQETQREQEELEYLENVRARREREEEEYRQMWAAEKLKAQQKLDEELRLVQQESLKKQQAMERDCLERELILKQKELEWVQLIQELEQFMTKLARKTQAQAAIRSEPVLKEASRQNGLKESVPGETEQQIRGEVNQGFDLGNASAPEVTLDERRGMLSDADPLFGSESTDSSESAVSALKEMLVTQGRKIESLNAEIPRKDPAPLKFQPKNHRTE